MTMLMPPRYYSGVAGNHSALCFIAVEYYRHAEQLLSQHLK